MVPEQRQNRVEEQINYGGDFEASGHPPDYGLPPPQTRKRSIDPRIPNRSSNQGPISNVRGSTNRGPVRRDTLPLDDPTYDEAIHGLGGRPAADPFRNIGMGGDFLADIPHGSELFRPRPQPQPNRVVKRSGRVGDRRRAEEPERQFGGRRSISAGFVRRAGDQPMAPRRKAPALPPRFERALWKRFREGFPEPVIRFYLEQLTQNDDPTPLGSNFLGEILKDEAISFHEGQPRQTWTAKKTLGSGAFGDVVLWERQRGIGQVSQMIPMASLMARRLNT